MKQFRNEDDLDVLGAFNRGYAPVPSTDNSRSTSMGINNASSRSNIHHHSYASISSNRTTNSTSNINPTTTTTTTAIVDNISKNSSSRKLKDQQATSSHSGMTEVLPSPSAPSSNNEQLVSYPLLYLLYIIYRIYIHNIYVYI